MPDPRIQQFTALWEQNPDPEWRDEFSRSYAEALRENNDPVTALGLLRETSHAVGSDLTGFFHKQPTIKPMSPDAARELVGDSIADKAPWYRRAFQQVVAAAEWEQNNIAIPAATTVIENLYGLVPGEQDFERNLTKARQDAQSKAIAENRNFTLRDGLAASRTAWADTNMSWGMKGFSEMVFDPLNLIGVGLPAKAMKAYPALKPILFPLKLIDEAPAKAVGKLFEGAAQLKRLPVIENLAKPHWASEVNEARRVSFQGMTDAFGVKIASDNPADTAALLNNLTRFPEDAGPHSLRNMFNHLGDAIPETKWNSFMDKLKEMTPRRASETVSELIAGQEARAIRKGGTKLSGEVVTESANVRRQKSLESVFRRMSLDEQHAKGLAQGIDQHIFGAFENVYLRKIEPNLVRPWALAHLAFAGYMPMNILEDVGMGMLGMNTTGKFNVVDAEWDLLRIGLTGEGIPPQHLNNVEGQARNSVVLATGQFREAEASSLQNFAMNTVGIGIKKSGEWGFKYRRGAWVTKFNSEFMTAAIESGVTTQELNALKAIVQTEFPKGLEHLRDDIGSKVWSMLRTGNADDVRQLKDIISTTSMVQKTQASLLTEFPGMPPDVRAKFLKSVYAEGGVTAANADIVATEMRDELMEWHKFSATGIKARIGDFVDALGKREVKSPQEAAGLLRMLQHAGDTITDLPREIRAHTKRRASKVPPGQRDALWVESIERITEDVAAVRLQYNAALERSRKPIERLLGETTKTGVQATQVNRSIDEIFSAYTRIGNSLDDTWSTFRARTSEHFASVPKAERDELFWLQYEEIGDEVWGAEKLTRIKESNIARTGWNSLLDTIPANVTGKDREFMKAGIESALESANNNQSELRVMLDELENNLDSLPDNLRPERIQRIEDVKEQIVIAGNNWKELNRRWERFTRRKTATPPGQLRDYDKAINALRVSVDEATKAGHTTAPGLNQQLVETLAERDEAFESLIPAFLRPEWDLLNGQRTHLQNLVDLGGRGSKARATELRKVNTAINRFTKRIETGDAFTELQRISGATDTVISDLSRDVLAANNGQIPGTLEDTSELIARMADEGNEPAITFIESMESLETRFGDLPLSEADEASPLMVTQEELIQRVFSKVVQNAEQPPLTPLQLQRLRESTTRDLFPDRAIVELVEGGFLENTQRLRDGKWRLVQTTRGEEALAGTVNQTIDISEVTAGLPDPVRTFDNTIDQMWGEMDTIVQRAVDVAENPPLTTEGSQRMGAYIDTVADFAGRNPDMQAKMRNARQVAGERTNTSYNQFFINYDNRNTLDFAMQRLMPFWMYESRRWPRLIRLAAQKPVLAKHMTLLMGDWDYGYTPTVGGFEFNPAKGAITNQLRSVAARDFPELHGGFRGQIEEGLDWLGRGGFFFAPPISATVDALQGEIGSTTPPPLALLLHAASASGANLPGILEDMAFDARYLQFQVDSVMADMGHNPTEIRRLVDEGDDTAAGIMYAAKHRASQKIIVNQQTSVTRYRPDSKKEFIRDSQGAIEEILGIPIEEQENLRTLGIHPYEIVPVSGFQRKQLRESIPNYDAWIGASISLRPIEEQRMIRKIDNFWAEVERGQELFERELKQLSDDWESGEVSGPQARKDLSSIKQFRSTMIDSIKARPEFVDVPLTLKDRQAHARKFNKPPQLPHPVDELLEAYYSVNPESLLFKNDVTGETNWDAYFTARDQVLNSATPEIGAIARDSLAHSDTPLERMLFVSKDWLREYYGIRQDLQEEAEQTSPGVTLAYIEYRRLQHLSKNSVDVEVSEGYRREAIEISARFPIVRDIESRVRSWRKDFREGDPTMETVFQMFISSPPTAPTIPQTRDNIRSVQGVAGVGGVSGVQGVRGIR